MERTIKLHPNYRIVGFDGTSRVYSTEPSLSQIPKPVRFSFLPPKGLKFLYFDLKAAELYIMIKWADCKELIDAYEKGEDLYTVIAKKVLNKDSVEKEERDKIKVVVLSILYGSEGGAASRALKIPEEEARAIIDKFYRSYPEIVRFHNKAYDYTCRNGYISTFCFRPRILKENFEDDSQRRRQSLNTSVQGTCADLMKKCIAAIPLKGPVRFVTSVFDSMLLTVPEDYNDEYARELIEDILREAYPFNFRYEFGYGYSFGEAQAAC